jgi:hypothetical protein
MGEVLGLEYLADCIDGIQCAVADHFLHWVTSHTAAYALASEPTPNMSQPILRQNWPFMIIFRALHARMSVTRHGTSCALGPACHSPRSLCTVTHTVTVRNFCCPTTPCTMSFCIRKRELSHEAKHWQVHCPFCITS